MKIAGDTDGWKAGAGIKKITKKVSNPRWNKKDKENWARLKKEYSSGCLEKRSGSQHLDGRTRFK